MKNTSRIGADSYAVSRVMYIIEALFENFITMLSSGAYLAKLTTTIGISDSVTAILAAVTSLSSVFQIVSIYLAHKRPIKPIVVPMQIISQVMFAGLYVIPLIGFDSGAVAVLCIVIVLANALKSISSPLKVNWFMSLVDAKKRGSYTAILQIVSIIGAIFFSLGASSVIDYFDAKNDMNGAFTTLSITILVLVIFCNVPFIFSKEKNEIGEKHPSPFLSLKDLLGNKKFVRAVAIFAIYSLASSIGTSFLGTYQIKELGFSMTFIAFIDVIINVVHIAALAIFGRLSFQLPYRFVIRIGYLIAIGTYVSLIFTTTSTGAVLFTMYRLFSTVYSSAIAVSQRNFLFEICPPEERTSAISIFTMATGIISFLATVATTPFFNYVQAHGVTVFGVSVYAQQILAAISLSLVILVNVLWNASYKKLEATEDYM